MITVIIRIFLYAIIIHLTVCVLAYFLQRSLQYHPNTSDPGTPLANGIARMQAVQVRTDDGLDLLAWYLPPQDEKNGLVTVHFHGNAGHIGHRAHKVGHFAARGMGVFFCEYRGYGGNKGAPSEQGFYTDARACLRYLRDRGVTPDRTVIYGESIGTGVAVQMASEVEVPYLVLEAPFASAVDVAKDVYFFLPVNLLMKDRFDNIEKIGGIKSKLLIIHGDDDRVIHISQAQKLFNAANHPKEFITIQGGGHSDLYDHGAGKIIADWLDKRPEMLREDTVP